VAEVLAEVARHGDGVDLADLPGRLEAPVGAVGAVVDHLVAEDGLALDEHGRLRRGVGADDDLVDAVLRRAEARLALERSRVEMVRAYAETTACRREHVLAYLGEPYEPPCDACDNCEDRRAATAGASSSATGPFPVGASVSHVEWGPGRVIRLDGDDRLTVLFDQVGYKVLSLPIVLEQRLLR
jgi:ATP-dependent DNA helicase RecQ